MKISIRKYGLWLMVWTLLLVCYLLFLRLLKVVYK